MAEPGHLAVKFMDRLGFIISSSTAPAPGTPRLPAYHHGLPHLHWGSPMSCKGSGSTVGTVCRGGRVMGHVLGLKHGAVQAAGRQLPVAACVGRALALGRCAAVWVWRAGCAQGCAVHGVCNTQRAPGRDRGARGWDVPCTWGACRGGAQSPRLGVTSPSCPTACVQTGCTNPSAWGGSCLIKA